MKYQVKRENIEKLKAYLKNGKDSKKKQEEGNKDARQQ